jgi:hypothetical protein
MFLRKKAQQRNISPDQLRRSGFSVAVVRNHPQQALQISNWEADCP